jgi:hypothetical protein
MRGSRGLRENARSRFTGHTVFDGLGLALARVHHVMTCVHLNCQTHDVKVSDMKTYRLSTRIDEQTRKRLEKRALIEAKDESAIVRDALNSYLSTTVESAHDVFQRIGGIGVAKGLPPDVSTNKKYFEGFGHSDRTRPSRHRSARRTSRT